MVRFNYLTEVRDCRLFIIGAERCPKIKTTHYRRNKNCPGKIYNPNSVDFVIKAYNLNSKEEAIEFIHSRNSSKFYRRNHKTDEDYAKSQSRDKNTLVSMGIDPEEHFRKIFYKQTLKYLVETHGTNIGSKIYNDRCKSKAITFDNLKSVYSSSTNDEILNILNNWKSKTHHSMENMINRYGESIGILKYNEFINKLSTIELRSKIDIFDHILKYLESIEPIEYKMKPFKYLINQGFGDRLKNMCTLVLKIDYNIILSEFLTIYPKYDIYDNTVNYPSAKD